METYRKYEGRSVLITGGLGFIGSSLARRLVQMGNVSVTVLDSLRPEQGGNLYNVRDIKDALNIHIADVADTEVTNHLVSGIDYIFNLAGSVSHVDSMASPFDDLHSNCKIQICLLEACRAFNPRAKIVFTSTRQVYGQPQYLPLDEEHRVQPTDLNGINKYAAEMYHLLYQRAYGLRCSILRLTNTYGPGQQMRHDRQGFFPWFVRQALTGGSIYLYGDGHHQRDVTYVDDVVDALLLAGANEKAFGEIMNLGHTEVYTLAEIAEMIIKSVGKGFTIGMPFPPDASITEIGNCHCSFSKIESLLGWRPKVSLREGIERTTRFYAENSEHYWNNEDSSV